MLGGLQVFRAEGEKERNTQRLHYKMEDFPRLLIKRGGNGALPEAPVPLIKRWEVIRNCYCTADKTELSLNVRQGGQREQQGKESSTVC